MLWLVILDCIMLETVRMPVAVARAPERAALKAVLVRVSILVASSPSMVQVSSRRLVQVIMIDRFPSFGTVVL